MEHWELAARESIRDLVARYNANGDTARFDEVVELFAPDAVMEVGGSRYAGREAIRGLFTSTAMQIRSDSEPRSGGDRDEARTRRYLRHFTATLQIDMTSPISASSRCYFEVLMVHGLDHWGRYLDEFGVVDGQWRFTTRRVITDGTTPGGFAAALGLNPA